MAVEEIIVDVSCGERRCAFFVDGSLDRFEFSRDDGGARRGDIYLGRVRTVMPGLDAAFVDVGLERAGFLAADDIAATGGSRRIADVVNEGEMRIVQISREPGGGKGAKLTARPALVGRNLVWLPMDSGVRLSPRLTASADDAAIAMIRAVLPAAGGWIVRAARCDQTAADVAAEAANLTKGWAAIAAAAATAAAPTRLAAGPDPVLTAIVENATPAVRRIVVNDAAFADRLRDSLPDLADRVSVRADAWRDAVADGVEDEIAALTAPTVTLPSGGVVTVAETAALIAFDVDTAAAAATTSALAVNLEAAAAIARLIRLRDLAGYMVIDFLPMRRRPHRVRLTEAMRRHLGGDDREMAVAGFTALGAFELTRRRFRPSLPHRLTVTCPACGGDGRIAAPATLARHAARQVLAEDAARPGRRWRIDAAPAVIDALRAPGGIGDEVARRLGRPVTLAAADGLAADRFTVSEERGGSSGG